MIVLLKKITERYLFIFILLISLTTRLFYLAYGMPSVTHDEADIYLSGRILAMTGKDGYNNKIFATTGFLTAKPSIPIYISALSHLVLPPASPFFSRLPFALINSLLPLFFYLIIFRLIGNKRFSLFSFLVLNFSPWFGLLSATGYEAFIGLTFLLIAFYSLIAVNQKRLSLSLSIIFLFFSFNSYMGLKIVFPLIVPMMFLYKSFIDKEKITFQRIFKTVLLSLILSGLFFAFSYVLPNRSLIITEGKRNLLFFNQEKNAEKLWYAAVTSEGPTIIKRMVSNKITVPLRDLFINYSESFNLQSLFFSGDNSPYGYAGLSGMFFMTDFIFLIIGILFFIKTPFRNLVPVLLTLFIIGGIPNAVAANSPSLTLRGGLLIIPYVLLIAYGIYYLAKKSRFFISIYLILLIFNLFLFQIIFQVRIKTLLSGHFHTTERNLTQYLINSKLIIKNVFVDEPKPTMALWLFYKKQISMFDIDNLKHDRYLIGQSKLLSGCPTGPLKEGEFDIVRKFNCNPLLAQTDIKSQKIISSVDKSNNDYYLISLQNE